MATVVKGTPFNGNVTGYETYLRRNVKLPKDTREFSPVQIRPDDITADIQNLKKNEHERSEQKKKFTEEKRYATHLLRQARSYNVRDLPREIPVKTLDEFISNPEKLNRFISNLENLLNEDSNVKSAQRLLAKAKFLNVKGIPDEVPRGDLSRFIKGLQKAIRNHKTKVEQAREYMLEMRPENKATESGSSHVLKSNCTKLALPLIAIVGAFLLLIK